MSYHVGVLLMIISVITKIIPVVLEFVKAVKDKKLSPEEIESLCLHAGLAIAAILKEIGLKA